MRDRITSRFGRSSTARDVAAGHDLSGLQIIVTGASSGLGVETSRAFAEAGASVTLAVRDMAAGARVAAEIDRTRKGPKVRVARVELDDVSSVRAFAAAWGAQPLNVLVNNAGVMACDHAYTRQGLEMQIGANHFGHALLTQLLIPNLEAAATLERASRVVMLTSSGHRESDIVWDDIHFRTRPYDRWKAYGQSKTANSLFAVALTRRFAERGVLANAVHPGGVRTPLQRHVTPLERQRRGWPADDAPNPQAMTVEQGAATSVWAALAPELEGVGGLYLEECAEALPAQTLPAGGVYDWALDPGSAERLWRVTMETLESL